MYAVLLARSSATAAVAVTGPVYVGRKGRIEMWRWLINIIIDTFDRLSGFARWQTKPSARGPRPRFVVAYDGLEIVSTQNEGISVVTSGKIIAFVGTPAAPKWLMLHCPCGCGKVRRINLSPHSGPAWRLRLGPGPSASLYPSVWLQADCYAHFILRDNNASVY
jgi:hypothetical protein